MKTLPAIRTPTEAIKSDAPSLATIKKFGASKNFTGLEVAMAVLTEMVDDTTRFFSVGKTMDDAKTAETCRLILQEFYFLKLSDLKLFFDRFKTGFYGPLFDRIDGNVIMVALRTYCEERITTAEALSLEAHKALKEVETEEMFYVCIGGKFWAKIEDDTNYSEVDKEELATQMTFRNAIALKAWLVRDICSEIPDKVKITRPKIALDLVAWKKENFPDLVPFKDKRDERVREIKDMLNLINKNDALSDYQKYVGRCKVLEAKPLPEPEWIQQELAFLKGKEKKI